jgi:hypothetical protein
MTFEITFPFLTSIASKHVSAASEAEVRTMFPKALTVIRRPALDDVTFPNNGACS